jgi:Protein of unknown function (DUF1488)
MTTQIAQGTKPVVSDGDVHFTLDINGTIQKFVVSHEALEDHFGKDGKADDLLAAFAKGRSKIFQIAERKHGAHPANVVMLLTAEF